MTSICVENTQHKVPFRVTSGTNQEKPGIPEPHVHNVNRRETRAPILQLAAIDRINQVPCCDAKPQNVRARTSIVMRILIFRLRILNAPFWAFSGWSHFCDQFDLGFVGSGC